MVFLWHKNGSVSKKEIKKGEWIMSTLTIFDTVPTKDYLSLYEDKKPQFNRITKFLNFKKDDIAKATGLSQNSVRYDEKMPPELKERIKEWAVLLNLVAGFFKGDPEKTHQWFITINPLLGDIAPRDMIRFGRFKKLFKFVMNALAENK
jgi:uncharacterized protein (DUF2384 family)